MSTSKTMVKYNYPKVTGSYYDKYKKYNFVITPDHPYAINNNAQKCVLEHRYLMERHLGRFLTPDEEVHHLNFNRTDNRLDNLLLIDGNKHSALHKYLEHHYVLTKRDAPVKRTYGSRYGPTLNNFPIEYFNLDAENEEKFSRWLDCYDIAPSNLNVIDLHYRPTFEELLRISYKAEVARTYGVKPDTINKLIKYHGLAEVETRHDYKGKEISQVDLDELRRKYPDTNQIDCSVLAELTVKYSDVTIGKIFNMTGAGIRYRLSKCGLVDRPAQRERKTLDQLPDKDELVNLISELGLKRTARFYQTGPSTLRLWVTRLGLDYCKIIKSKDVLRKLTTKYPKPVPPREPTKEELEDFLIADLPVSVIERHFGVFRGRIDCCIINFFGKEKRKYIYRLISYYVNNGYSVKQIGEVLDLADISVICLIQENNKTHPESPIVPSKETVKFYLDNHKTLTELATMYGVSVKQLTV